MTLVKIEELQGKELYMVGGYANLLIELGDDGSLDIVAKYDLSKVILWLETTFNKKDLPTFTSNTMNTVNVKERFSSWAIVISSDDTIVLLHQVVQMMRERGQLK